MIHDEDAQPHVAELWESASTLKVSPSVHLQRYEAVRLILSTGGREITDEEVMTWPPIDHAITFEEIIFEANRLDPIPSTNPNWIGTNSPARG